ncbi:MAG: c-type cytochrome domain-containing protein [Prosthecobacter sp.]
MKPATIALATLALASATASAVDYASQIAPIFRAKCYECHHTSKKVKGDVDLADNKMSESIGAGKHIVPNEPKKSTMLIYCALPDDDEDVMPPKGKNRLTPAELKVLETWITEGASLTAGGAAPTAAAPAAGGAQKWTSADGKIIEATFVRLDGDNVVLTVIATGTTHAVPLSRLSPESQAQAKAAK